MEIIKAKNRTMKIDEYAEAMKLIGWEVKQIAEYDRWKEVYGGQLQDQMNVYRIKTPETTAYVLADGLYRMASTLTADKSEVMEWLKAHGYKKDKDWYIEDAGMTEELWQAWNNAEDI